MDPGKEGAKLLLALVVCYLRIPLSYAETAVSVRLRAVAQNYDDLWTIPTYGCNHWDPHRAGRRHLWSRVRVPVQWTMEEFGRDFGRL